MERAEDGPDFRAGVGHRGRPSSEAPTREGASEYASELVNARVEIHDWDVSVDEVVSLEEERLPR